MFGRISASYKVLLQNTTVKQLTFFYWRIFSHYIFARNYWQNIRLLWVLGKHSVSFKIFSSKMESKVFQKFSLGKIPFKLLTEYPLILGKL